jgi:hypothetical protein
MLEFTNTPPHLFLSVTMAIGSKENRGLAAVGRLSAV